MFDVCAKNTPFFKQDKAIKIMLIKHTENRNQKNLFKNSIFEEAQRRIFSSTVYSQINFPNPAHLIL